MARLTAYRKKTKKAQLVQLAKRSDVFGDDNLSRFFLELKRGSNMSEKLAMKYHISFQGKYIGMNKETTFGANRSFKKAQIFELGGEFLRGYRRKMLARRKAAAAAAKAAVKAEADAAAAANALVATSSASAAGGGAVPQSGGSTYRNRKQYTDCGPREQRYMQVNHFAPKLNSLFAEHSEQGAGAATLL